MQCPNCTQTLMTTERRGIEIDHCQNCGGVWLDKGELEKILSLADGEQPSRDWRRGEEDREESYGRSRSRGSDYEEEQEGEGEFEGEGRYEEDEEEGGYRERGRYEDEDRQGGERYGREGGGRDDRGYDRDAPRGERPSIWREIFENLEKLPLPRV